MKEIVIDRKDSINKLKCIAIILVVVFIQVILGCARTNFYPVGPSFQRNTRTVDQIEFYLEGQRPTLPHKIVGAISAYDPSTFKNIEKSMKMLRERAAQEGLDGVCDIYIAPLGTVDSTSATGKGFVYIK